LIAEHGEVEQGFDRETLSVLGKYTIGIVLLGIGHQRGYLLVAAAEHVGVDMFALAVDLFSGRSQVNDVTVAPSTTSHSIIVDGGQKLCAECCREVWYDDGISKVRRSFDARANGPSDSDLDSLNSLSLTGPLPGMR
jgi:hypothetical protein